MESGKPDNLRALCRTASVSLIALALTAAAGSCSRATTTTARSDTLELRFEARVADAAYGCSAPRRN